MLKFFDNAIICISAALGLASIICSFLTSWIVALAFAVLIIAITPWRREEKLTLCSMLILTVWLCWGLGGFVRICGLELSFLSYETLWDRIYIDFCTGLATCLGFGTILFVIDRIIYHDYPIEYSDDDRI